MEGKSGSQARQLIANTIIEGEWRLPQNTYVDIKIKKHVRRQKR